MNLKGMGFVADFCFSGALLHRFCGGRCLCHQVRLYEKYRISARSSGISPCGAETTGLQNPAMSRVRPTSGTVIGDVNPEIELLIHGTARDQLELNFRLTIHSKWRKGYDVIPRFFILQDDTA